MLVFAAFDTGICSLQYQCSTVLRFSIPTRHTHFCHPLQITSKFMEHGEQQPQPFHSFLFCMNTDSCIAHQECHLYFGVMKEPPTFSAYLDSKKILLKLLVDQGRWPIQCIHWWFCGPVWCHHTMHYGYNKTEVDISMDHSLLPIHPARHLNLYRRVIHPQHPTLYYIGCLETTADASKMHCQDFWWENHCYLHYVMV